ncbi:MAG: winged helix-turn-helix transcriptional regulator [Chlamydiia bacterium]|nr:winged helix-turn-helix transcriptional regulator [Chlamydiia bacterium]
MFEELFGNKNIEKILFYLLMNEKAYATELSTCFGTALAPWQKALERLENAGVLISTLRGKTRLFEFNPRYFFLNELRILISKGYQQLPNKIKETYYERKIRKRPRKKGKQL